MANRLRKISLWAVYMPRDKEIIAFFRTKKAAKLWPLANGEVMVNLKGLYVLPQKPT